jgi:hypothetical protein
MSDRAETSGPSAPHLRGRGIDVPGLPVAGGLMLALAIVYWATGVLAPTALPDYADSPREIIGMGLLLTLVPPYLVAATFLGQRRSLALLAEARTRTSAPAGRAEIESAAEAVRDALHRSWWGGLAFGVLMGLLNSQPVGALRGPMPLLEGSISFGQIFMWSLIGLTLGVRVTTARAFRRVAAVVDLDLFEPERPRAVTRSGMVDVLIVAGALLLAPLQSLDAEFRWYNYQNGLLVGIPTSVFCVLSPLLPVRRRHRAVRDARLAEIERQLAGVAADGDPPASPEASARLEGLLAHRDRLRHARTWPLGMRLVSRVVLYLVIPPLAWAGAAVVERLVDALLAG